MNATTSITEVIEYVKAYVRQETIGPLRGAGRWLAFGAAGALVLGVGLSFVLLGLLRLVQHEWDFSARGRMSWLPYLIVLVACVGLLFLTIKRINKSALNKEPN